MGNNGEPHELQELLEVSYGDEIALFPTIVFDQQVLLVQRQRWVYCFRLESNGPTGAMWKQLWARENFFDGNPRNIVSSVFVDSSGWVLMKTRTGLQIYRMQGHDLNLRHYTSDGRYRDMYGWSGRETLFLMGHIYDDDGAIGVLSRNKRGDIRFEQMAKSIVLEGGSQPLWKLSNGPNVPESWKLKTTWLGLAIVEAGNTQRSAIVERSLNAIIVYKLDEKYQLQMLANVIGVPFVGADKERILFGNVFGTSIYKDMLHFNGTGLFLYAHDGTNYRSVLQDRSFSEGTLGWSPEHWRAAGLIKTTDRDLDELWLTGPQGMARYRISKQGIEQIHSPTQYDDNLRNGKLKGAVTAGSKPIIIALGGKKLYSFGIQLSHESTSKPDADTIVKDDTCPDLEPMFTLHSDPTTRPIVEASLAEMLDTSLLREPINPTRGSLDFAIPLLQVGRLFSLPTSKFIAYQETVVDSSMGRGWSLLVDCVFIDRRGSIFAQDHRYYLVRDGSTSLLTASLSNDSSDKRPLQSFTIEGNNQTTITFDRTQNQWSIVNDSGENFTYGTYGEKTFITMDNGSADWPFPIDGDKYREQPGTLLPSVWYLIRHSDRAGQWVEYSYRRSMKEFLLDSITTSAGATLRLSHTEQLGKTLFTSFAIHTASYTQTVVLEYVRTLNEVVRLRRISQQNRTVLQFSYDGPSGEMTEIIFPNGLVSRFDYTLLQIDPNLLQNRFETFSHPRAAYGPAYLLIADITKHGQVRLRLRDFLGSDTIPIAGSSIPLLGNYPVTNYEIFPGESYFAILLHHEKQPSELCLFQAKADVWQANPAYLKLPRATTLRTGQDFLLAVQAHRVTVIERHNGEWKTSKPFQIEESALMYHFSHGFVSYTSQRLKLFVRRNGQWTPTILDVPSGLIDSSYEVFDRFDHSQDSIQQLKKGIRPDTLGMFHNIIVVRSLFLDGHKLFTRLQLLHLSRKHELTRREVINILIEDLDKYTFNPPEQDGNTFVFGYRMEDGKFKLRVIEHRGKIMQEVEKIKEQIEQEIRNEPNAPQEEKERYRQESLQKINNELENLYRNITAQIPFAIDPAKLGVIISDGHIITASHKVRFDGVEWSKERIPQEELTMEKVSINLGAKYRLVKAHRNATFDLFGPNQSIQLSTETSDANDLHIRYPGFLAVQTNGSSVQLFDFERGQLNTLPAEEKMEASSNQLAVITTQSDGKKLLVRSMKCFGVTLQNTIWRHDLIDSRQRRVTKYYQFDPYTAKPHESGFLLSDVKITPVSIEGPYGWYKEHYNFANHTQSTKTVYNSRGEFVKQIDKSSIDAKQPPNPDGVLTARDGKTIVVDFRPYRISDQVVSYYGFEPYEQNRIGSDQAWTWKNGQVMQMHGNHFLRLGQSSSVSGVFQPQFLPGMLIISCWLRSARATFDVEASMSVTHGGKTSKGKIAATVEGWKYVEVIVEVFESSTDFVVNISPANNVSSTLDVDHLRVSPIQLELEVNIYDRLTTNRRSVMRGSGMMSHFLYDPFGNEMGRINEEGSIDGFTLMSRVQNVRIEMTPTLGELLTPNQLGYSGSFKYIPEAVVIRFRYSGASETGKFTVQIATRTFTIDISSNQGTLRVQHHSAQVPPAGDIAIFCTNSRYSVWVDGNLMLENQAPKLRLDQYTISSTHGQIWDAIVLYDPNVKVAYLTDIGMPKQILELQAPNVVALQEIVYDELNRPAIKTKWTQLNATDSSALFAYRHNFITNEAHIWKRHLMEGLVSELNDDCAGYPYSRTVYLDTPEEEKAIQSMPGKSFSISGAFAKHSDASVSIDFLENLFPQPAGFRYEYERFPDQSIYAKVYDDRKRKVAEYVRAHHGDHHLTTFQYDNNDRLILQLPPAYHEAADSFSRTSPFFGGAFSADLLKLQHAWGTWYEYDQASGLITLKRTPDTGDVRYMYTPEGLLRFVVQQGTRNVMYFSYTAVGRLAQKGMIDMDFSDLPKYLKNDSELPSSSNFVLFTHADSAVAPQHRHRVENIQKVSNDLVLSELLLFDHEKQLTSSVLYSTRVNHTLPIGYKYCKNQVHEIIYPTTVGGKRFRLRYEYDNRGKIISMANAATSEKFVVMENNGMGLPKHIIVQPHSPYAFRRTFEYNEPGYLTRIKDPYLTESIDYVGNGYGGRPIGDGTVQMTRFNATWHAHSDAQFWKLKASHFGGRSVKVCYDALKSSGHLDTTGRPTKSVYPLVALELPIVCRLGTLGNHVAAVLNGAGFPQLYGHRYDYGSHRQLIRAKYFQNAAEEMYEPLRKNTFAKINGINATASENIWTTLHEAGYVHSDCSAIGRADCQGLPGRSIFHPTIVKHPNAATLGGLMVRVITHRKELSKSSFDKFCGNWYRDDYATVIPEACSSIWTTLINENFIGPGSNFGLQALDPKLLDLLSEYTPHLPAIIGTLYHQLATALGQSSGDVQSYEIDANGNHRHFYTGFRRYRLEYAQHSNKIAAVHRLNLASPGELEETRFAVHHNEDGSVTRAMHKGIQRIAYDPLYNRATEIVLSDGRRLKFDYNVRGQRLYKLVYDRTGRLMRKKYYVRDVQGKVLVEYEACYQAHDAAGTRNAEPREVVRATVFLYTDSRLIGFIRNEQFYSVTLDHEGSVRLVVKNGEIVAAYDYLPYGELLRKYGEDPSGQLDYRFTGKEWDDETGLYDFHARLYDPELGRFFQMDPKEQYASPYLYAENSPVSLIDPDGQFAFLLVVVAVAGGAYVGASAANNSWNPAKWNLKKALIGGLVGGLVGFLAPGGITAGFSFLSGYIGATAAIGVMTTTSVGFAYLSMSAANGSWDPSKWDWSSPGTWNALFMGSLTGANIFNVLAGAQKAFLAYTGLSRTAFVIVATGTTGGFFLYSGSQANDGNLLFWEWDWSKPGTVWGAIEGASFGLTISPRLSLATEQVAGRLEHFKEIGKAVQSGNIKGVSGLLKVELKAWEKIFRDIIAGEHVKEGMKAGAAAGAMTGTSLLPQIPKEAIEVMEEIFAVIKIVDEFTGRKPRNIDYGNSTSLMTLGGGQNPIATFAKEMKETGTTNYDTEGMMLLMSSSGRISHWINTVLGTVFGSTKGATDSKPNSETGFVQPYSSKRKNFKRTYDIPNCYSRKSSGVIDRVVCYEPYGLSYIFPHTGTNEVPMLAEDSYSQCYPIEYEGLPSVVCSGTNSSYVFTPYAGPVNSLDHLNGALTLLLVSPAILRNVASVFRTLLSGNTRKPELSQTASSVEKSCLGLELAKLKNAALQCKMRGFISFSDRRWLYHMLEDIEEDVQKFLIGDDPSREVYDQLKDRIDALNEEVTEMSEISVHTLYSNVAHSSNDEMNRKHLNAVGINSMASKHIPGTKMEFISQETMFRELK